MAIELRRTLAAPVQRVWDAWTTKADLEIWYGPEGCEVEQLDLQPGGEYRRVMGGHVDYGVFHEIDAPRKLSQGPADGSVIMDTILEEVPEGTRMTLRMMGLPAEYEPGVEQAWNGSFDRLAKLVA